MKMIIGGAFQGKYQYAQKNFEIEKWIDGETCQAEEIFDCQGVNHFHEYIRRQMQKGNGWENKLDSLAEEIIKKNPDILIVSDEVGYGVVPMDQFQREYRERVGRICTELATFSTQVHRVVCGVGTVIKSV